MPNYDVNITRYPFPALPDEAVTNTADKKLASEDTTAELTLRGPLQ